MAEKLIYELETRGAGKVVSEINAISSAVTRSASAFDTAVRIANRYSNAFKAIDLRRLPGWFNQKAPTADVIRDYDRLGKLIGVRRETRERLRQKNPLWDSEVIRNANVLIGSELKSDVASKIGNLFGSIREKRERLIPIARERLRQKLGDNWWNLGITNANPSFGGIPTSQEDKDKLANRIALQRLARERLRQKLGMDWESRGVANAKSFPSFGGIPTSQEDKDKLANRIALQRLARERLRRKLGMDWESRGVANANPANPNSPNYNAPPPPSRWDRWSDNAYERIKTLVPKGAARDIIGRIQGMGTFGKTLGLFVAGILAAGAALAILRKIVTSLFAPLSAMADEVFKFYRTRHQMGGLNNGELSKMGWAGYIMGGKPEENYALMARISGERASLLWGGNGGKYMSVARRFGVDISGSGAGGLATEREWLRAIAIRMQELDSSGRLALANEAGLSREQMWLVSNGLRYYDWASSRRTLGQMAWGGMLGEDVYTDNFQKESQNFWTDFGSFMAVFKEFWGSVSEILLPVINLILELLTGIFGLLNLVLKPIATLIGKIFSLLNISFWTNMANMESSIPNYGKYDMGMMQTTMYQHPNANIKVGDINVTSSRADPEEVAKDVGNAVVQAALTRIYDAEAGGAERSVA